MTANVDLKNAKVRHGIQWLGSVSTSLVAVAAMIWFIVKPAAHDLIEDRVDIILTAGNFAKSDDVQKLNRNVEQSQQRIRDLERKQDRNNAKAEAERAAIKEKIDDTNQLIRDVLRMRRSPN